VRVYLRIRNPNGPDVEIGTFDEGALDLYLGEAGWIKSPREGEWFLREHNLAAVVVQFVEHMDVRHLPKATDTAITIFDQ